MNAWQRWVERPQRLWVRRALFQIHLWVGIGVGLYVLAISISGSAIVFRRQLARRYSRKTVVITVPSNPRISAEQLKQIAQRDYSRYDVDGIYESTRPDRADEIVLGLGAKRISRMFDPYTGADLGDPETTTFRALLWLVDLHDNLLGGQTGRVINGIGAFFFTILFLTGVVIWWPGIKHWRRALAIKWDARFARLNWDVHSAIGFWCSLFVLVWGVSGIYLCFPGTFSPFISDRVLASITRLHFGRFNSLTETLWTILGLAPAALFITGALMWWNRVLRKKLRQLR
jgi:uncharacterized iron-regulated membrane protein